MHVGTHTKTVKLFLYYVCPDQLEVPHRFASGGRVRPAARISGRGRLAFSCIVSCRSYWRYVISKFASKNRLRPAPKETGVTREWANGCLHTKEGGQPVFYDVCLGFARLDVGLSKKARMVLGL